MRHIFTGTIFMVLLCLMGADTPSWHPLDLRCAHSGHKIAENERHYYQAPPVRLTEKQRRGERPVYLSLKKPPFFPEITSPRRHNRTLPATCWEEVPLREGARKRKIKILKEQNLI
jgi:hypothetical protein